MAIELWLWQQFSSQVKLVDKCLHLGPPAHPNMESSSFKMKQKHKTALTLKPIFICSPWCKTRLLCLVLFKV